MHNIIKIDIGVNNNLIKKNFVIYVEFLKYNENIERNSNNMYNYIHIIIIFYKEVFIWIRIKKSENIQLKI